MQKPIKWKLQNGKPIKRNYRFDFCAENPHFSQIIRGNAANSTETPGKGSKTGQNQNLGKIKRIFKSLLKATE